MRRRGFFGWVLAGALAAPETALADAPVGLRDALAVEQLAVFICQSVLADGTLTGTSGAVARRILRHDQTHVRILSGEVTGRGESLPARPASVAEADRRLSALHASLRLAHVRTRDDALRILYDVESLTIGKYYEALQTLVDPRLIRLAAEIMAADAQHASAIGGLLHPGKWDQVVPAGAVRGKR